MFSEAGRDIGCYGLDPNDHHLSKTWIFIEQKYAFFSGRKRTWSIGSQTISQNCHLQKTKYWPHEIKYLFSQEENRKHWPLWIGSWTILSSSRQTFTGEPSSQAILLMTRPGTEDQVTFFHLMQSTSFDTVHSVGRGINLIHGETSLDSITPRNQYPPTV